MTRTAMFIAPDILEKFFNGDTEDKNAKKMLDMLTTRGDKDTGIDFVTSQSAFLQAIWKTEHNKPIQNIQKALTFLQIIPSFANFKNEEDVRNEIIKMAIIMGERK